MPIVPAGNLSKSVRVGTPYSPAASFNPDKKLFFDTESTTLGVLGGPPVTTDGVNVTVPTGFKFIQNGIIVKLTAPFIVPIPVIAFPKFIIADNVDETPGSAVTIAILTTITPPQILIGTLDPNNSTLAQARNISIRGLALDIDAAKLDVKQDAAPVKGDITALNVIGPNAVVTDPGGTEANIGVILDVHDDGVPATVRTKLINVVGATVTPTSANDVTLDVRLVGKDEGVDQVLDVRTIDFQGGGVSSAVDGGDPQRLNVVIEAGGGKISATESVMGDGIIKGLIDGNGGIRQLDVTSLFVLKGGTVYGPITTTVAIPTNVSGSPRTDLIQYDGITITAKNGTPGATFPCPSPDPGNIPLAVVLVPDSPPNYVDSMNTQGAVANAVIVAYYYANGGLHASRVGVTPDPSTSSSTYIDADEMALSVYFPRLGYRYELNWDTVIAQSLYGFLNEGALINMSWDGVDESEDVVRRGYLHNNLLGGVSIHGFEITVAMHYNRKVTLGTHLMKGRWKVGQISTAEKLARMRRRIWIVETA